MPSPIPAQPFHTLLPCDPIYTIGFISFLVFTIFYFPSYQTGNFRENTFVPSRDHPLWGVMFGLMTRSSRVVWCLVKCHTFGVKYMSFVNLSLSFFFAEKKKGLAGAFIFPTHLNPILTWRGAHLGNNGTYHYPNPQLPDSQVWWITRVSFH